MKFFIALLLSIFSYNRVVGQQSLDTVYYTADEVYAILTDSLPDKLGIGCGYIGDETENISYFLLLVEAEKYDYIKKLTYSNLASNQLLSVLAIKILADAKKIIIDEKLLNRILEIKNSDIILPSCCGCLSCNAGKLKHLLNKRGRNNHLVKRLRDYIQNAIDNK